MIDVIYIMHVVVNPFILIFARCCCYCCCCSCCFVVVVVAAAAAVLIETKQVKIGKGMVFVLLNIFI